MVWEARRTDLTHSYRRSRECVRPSGREGAHPRWACDSSSPGGGLPSEADPGFGRQGTMVDRVYESCVVVGLVLMIV